MKKYRLQGAKLNNVNQIIDLFFWETTNCHQIGNGYLKFDITLRKNGGNFHNIFGDVGDGIVNEPTRMINIGFGFSLSKATLSTTGGEEIEQNTYVGHVTTTMRISTSEDGDLLSYFDKSNETQIGIKG